MKCIKWSGSPIALSRLLSHSVGRHASGWFVIESRVGWRTDSRSSDPYLSLYLRGGSLRLIIIENVCLRSANRTGDTDNTNVQDIIQYIVYSLYDQIYLTMYSVVRVCLCVCRCVSHTQLCIFSKFAPTSSSSSYRPILVIIHARSSWRSATSRPNVVLVATAAAAFRAHKLRVFASHHPPWSMSRTFVSLPYPAGFLFLAHCQPFNLRN